MSLYAPMEVEPEVSGPLFAEERGTFGDFASNLYRGFGHVTELIGRGAQQLFGTGEGIQQLGEQMLASEFAKQDVSEFYGTDSRLKKIGLMSMQVIPSLALTAGAGAIGTAVAGPIGGVGAALTAMGTAFGGGTYNASVEEYWNQNPYGDEEDAHRYGMVDSASELGSEILGTFVAFGAGKVAKPFLKNGIKNLINSGSMSATDVITNAVGKKSVGDLAASLTAGGVVEGASEVANELVQRANADTFGMERGEANLLDTFAAAMLPGSTLSAMGAVSARGKIKQVRSVMERGLSSESVQTRQDTVTAILSGITNTDPAYAKELEPMLRANAQDGPMSLETVLRSESDVAYDTITKNPEAILKQHDIPIGPEEAVIEPGAIQVGPEALTRYEKKEPTGFEHITGTPRPLEELEVPGMKRTPEGEYLSYDPELPENILRSLEIQREEAVVNEQWDRVAAFDKRIDYEHVNGFMQVLSDFQAGQLSEQELKTTKEGFEKSEAEVAAAKQEVADEVMDEADAIRIAISKEHLNQARAKAIRSGMESVISDTNTLSMTEDLNERAKLKQKIQKNVKLISDEVAPETAEVRTARKTDAKVTEFTPEAKAEVATVVDESVVTFTEDQQKSLSAAVQAGIDIEAPEVQQVVRDYKGTPEAFPEHLKVPRAIETTKEIPEGKKEGVTTVRYHDGTVLVYDKNLNKAVRSTIKRPGKQDVITGSLTSAKEAIAEGKVDELRPAEAKGEAKKVEERIVKSDVEVRDAFLKENIDAFSNEELGHALEATQEILNKGEELTLEAVKNRTKALAKRATEAESEFEAAAKKGATVVGDMAKVPETKVVAEAEVPTEKKVPIEEPKEEPKAKPRAVVTRRGGRKSKEERRKAGLKADLFELEQVDAEELSVAELEVHEQRIADLKEELDMSLETDAYLAALSKEDYKATYDMWIGERTPTEALDNFLVQFPDGAPTKHLRAVEALIHEELLADMAGTRSTFTKQYETAFDLLEGLMKNASEEVKAGAKWVMDSKKAQEKLKGIPVTVSTSSYFRPSVPTLAIGARKIRSYDIWLHEIEHAVTSNEMRSNEELAKDVDEMVGMYKEGAKGLLNEEQLKLVEDAKGSSKKFQEIKDGTAFSEDELHIAYAMVNKSEFLAQRANSGAVRRALASIRYTGSRVTNKNVKSVLDQLVGWFKKIMGIKGDYTSLLEQSLSVSRELYDTEVTQYGDGLNNALEYTEAERKQTPEEAAKLIMAAQETKVQVFKGNAMNKLKEAKDSLDKLARPVADHLRVHSEKLYARLMKMEAKMNGKNKTYSRQSEPFLKWYKGLTKEQAIRFDIGLMNRNEDTYKQIPEAVRKELEAMLGDLGRRSIDVNLLEKLEERYFPRRVADVQGLGDYYLNRGNAEEKGLIGGAIKSKEKIEGRSLTDAEKNQLVTDMLSSGNTRWISRPGAAKHRTVFKVTDETYKFYMNSSEALTAHIYDMNEKVGLREFVGASTRKKDIQSLKSLGTKIRGEKDKKKREALLEEWDAKAAKLDDLESDLQSGVSDLIRTELGDADTATQQAVTDMLRSRMMQKGTHGIVANARDIGYLAAMGNVLSAITQFGDIPIIFKRYGVNKDTIKAAMAGFTTIGRMIKGDITGKRDYDAYVDDLDFTNALREFGNGSMTTKALDTVFKYSGLRYTDLVGKEASLRASMKYYQKHKKEFMKKYEPFFGENTESVHQKIMVGNKKDTDVQTFLFAELAEFQPISLSQQSQMYLTGGNLRMAFMLKTFGLRTMAAAMRESRSDIMSGEPKKIANGVKTFSSILLLYAVAGAGADELKDIIKGEEHNISEHTMDNLIQLFMMSSFTIEQGIQKDNLISSLVANLLPPVRYADNFVADITSSFTDKEMKFKSLRQVPVIGNVMYSRSEAGTTSYQDRKRKEIMEKVKKNAKGRKGARAKGVTDMVRVYNRTVSSDNKITNADIMRAYRS